MNSPTEAGALLLPATALVRFIPNAHFNGNVTLSYRAWDLTQGSVGLKLKTAGNQGGSKSLSTAVETATLTVNHVNHPAAFQNRAITPEITEGGTVYVTGHITDIDPQDPFFLDINWGDGTPVQSLHFAPDTSRDIKVGHRYLDDPAGTDDKYVVQLSWHDQVSIPKKATLETMVHNAAPVIGDVSASLTLKVDQPIVVHGAFSDRGPNDTFLVLVQWSTNGPWESVNLPAGSDFFQLKHKYTKAGDQQVTILLLDKDLGFTTKTFILSVRK